LKIEGNDKDYNEADYQLSPFSFDQSEEYVIPKLNETIKERNMYACIRQSG